LDGRIPLTSKIQNRTPAPLFLLASKKMATSDDTSDDASFEVMPQIFDKYISHFFNVAQSELHKPAGMVLPKWPIYHPYHPFNKTDGDDILQVPLAMTLPDTKYVPRPLLDIISTLDVQVVPYFVAQTLPYEDDTEVIPRYQYALFPDAKSEMKGFESIYAQCIIYEEDLFCNISSHIN
jgi:hypothetical protein